MSRGNYPLLSLNGGEVSTNALARVDLEKMRLCAELQRNLIPRTVGAAIMRPGLEYVGTTKSNAKAKFFDFVFTATDTAAFEFTDSVLRIWRGEPLAPITRTAVSTAITNGTFTSITGWTHQSAGGGAYAAGAGITLGSIARGGYSRVLQAVAVSGGDQNKPHGLRIIIANGPVLFRVGSTSGGQEYIKETKLEKGYHSLEFTPTGSPFYVQFENRKQRDVTIASIAIEGAGVVELPTIYAESDLPYIRRHQTGDLVYLACYGKKPQKIERRSATSFSIVDFRPEDGPLSPTRTTETRLKPSVTEGNGILTSEFPFFQTDHVGAVFELYHDGYNTTTRLGAENQFTDPIRISGITANNSSGVITSSDREWSYAITGTWTGRWRAVRSFNDPDTGYTNDNSAMTGTANKTGSRTDDQDNIIIYYKMGIRPGDYTSGVMTINLQYDGGGGFGRCRVTGYTSPTQVSIEVLKPFTNVTYTEDWKEGLWSSVQAWPSAVSAVEGRLAWGYGDQIALSVSDSFDSYEANDDTLGDAQSIQKTISSAAVDRVTWILPLQRLVVGTGSGESTARSSSLDEPLKPSAFTVRDAGTQGSSDTVPAVKVDASGYYVQRSNNRIYRLAYSSDVQDYASADMTRLNDEILRPGVVAMGVQRQLDTRLHVMREDGIGAIFLSDFIEEVAGWITVETAGIVEDVFILPGDIEDRVYYVVRREINGSTVRYVEKWALESECINGTVNKVADSCVTYTGAATTTISGLSHLEGESVVVWANGAAIADGSTAKPYKVVSGGQITLSTAATNVTVGLPYRARFKSAKLAYGAQLGTALGQKKQIKSVNLVLANAHILSVKLGQSFDELERMPSIEEDDYQDDDTVYDVYDEVSIPVRGRWDTDSRLCLEINAPYSAKVLGVVIGLETHEKA